MSFISEAFRTIRTALYFGVPKEKSQVFLITSPTPGDGNLVQSLRRKFPLSTIYAPKTFEKWKKRKVGYIIANPPFTPMTRGYNLLDTFFGISNNIIILMPWLAIINSERRTKRYVEQGLKSIHHLPRRAFPGSRVQTCILVFQKGYSGIISFEVVK